MPNTQSYYVRNSITVKKDNDRGWTSMGILLHNVIMDTNLKSGEIVDHISHDTLDNRKSNLRILDNKTNLLNRKGANKNTTTGVRNVSYANKTKQYLVQFQVNGKNTCFGRYEENEFSKAVELANKLRKELYDIKLT